MLLSASEQVAQGSDAVSIFRSSVIGTLGMPAPAIMPSLFTADQRLAASYSEQASFAVEYLLAANLTLTTSYLRVRGVKLSRTRNVNLLPPVPLTLQNAADLGIPHPAPQQVGRPVFGPGRALSRFNNIYSSHSTLNSRP